MICKKCPIWTKLGPLNCSYQLAGEVVFFQGSAKDLKGLCWQLFEGVSQINGNCSPQTESASRSDGWWVSRVDSQAVQLPCKVNINTSAESSYQATCSSPAESEKQLESAWRMQTEEDLRNEIHPATATSAAAGNSEPRPCGKVTLVQVDAAEGEASTL